jgi:hypothetical protein
MGFKEINSLDADVITALGGVNKKTGKPNPTRMEGYFLGSREVESKMSKTGTAKIHFLETSKGKVGIWGKTDLDRKLKQVTPGIMVRITQDGKVNLPGKQPMYKFRVEVDAENTIEVAAQEESSVQSEEYSETGLEDVQNAGADLSDDSELIDDNFEDTLEDETPADEQPPARPKPPARAASTPDAARQAKVKELLAKGRNKSA